MTEEGATSSPINNFCERNLENRNLIQLSTVTPLPSSDVVQDSIVAGPPASAGSKLSRAGRGRSSRPRGSGGNSALSGLINEKIPGMSSRDNSQSHSLLQQTELRNESASDFNNLMSECMEARNGGPFVMGSQSDPTLTLSFSSQESRIKKQSGRAVTETNHRSLEPVGRQVLESTAEKVMDAYIEKFSVIGYTNSGGCIGVTDSLMPLRIDPSRRPGSLQEAICMYIDYLICENELRTRISECSATLPPPLADFHREEYYRDVMCRPVNFPTARFREWLKLYNVDIEITDPDGRTVSQTTFAPTAPVGGLSGEQSYVQQDSLVSMPNFTWQLGSGTAVDVEPGGFAAMQQRRNQRVRIEPGSQPTVTSWVSNTGPAAMQPQHRQAVSYLPQYGLPALPPARIESCCGSQQMSSSTSSPCYSVSNVVMPQSLNAIQTDAGSQQSQQTSFMEFDAGIIDLADQRHQLYSDSAEHEPTAEHMLHDLDESSIFAYGVMLKDEVQNDRPVCGVTQLQSVDLIMQSDGNANSSQEHVRSAEALITNEGDERLNLGTFTVSNSGTSSMTDANFNSVKNVDQSVYHYSEAQSLTQSTERTVVDQRILRNVDISRKTGSVVVDCRLGYEILRSLESNTIAHSYCGSTEVGAISQENAQSGIDLIPVTRSEDSSSTGCHMLNVSSGLSVAASEMTTRLLTTDAMQIISDPTDAERSTGLSNLVAENEHLQQGENCSPSGRGVDWRQSVAVMKSNGPYSELTDVSNTESSLNCNTDIGFGGFSETAAAVASLEFEHMSPVSFMGRTGEAYGKRGWPDPKQWQPRASFNNGYDANSTFDEPTLKSAKFDDLGSNSSQYHF